MPLPSDESLWAKMKIIFATANGKVRKNSLLDFENIQQSGKIAMKLEDTDTIVGIKILDDDDDFLLSSKNGKALRVQSKKLRLFKGRSSKGIKGMALKKDDKIISLSILKSVKITSDEAKSYIKASRLEKDLDETPDDDSETTNIVKLSNKQIQEFKNKEQYILTVTENGYGKRSSAYEYRVSGRGGQGIINIISSEKGKSLRVQSKKLRLFKGRSSKGIKGMSLKKDDKIISLSILKSVKITSDEAKSYIKASRLEKDVEETPDDENETTKIVTLSKKQIEEFKNKEQYILTVTENGYGKRSSAYEYRVSGRGGQGIINIISSERNGGVASTFTINHEDQIMLITDKGQMIRCNVKDIRITGRNTQGVRIFNLSDDEKVVSAARVEDSSEENN